MLHYTPTAGWFKTAYNCYTMMYNGKICVLVHGIQTIYYTYIKTAVTNAVIK